MKLARLHELAEIEPYWQVELAVGMAILLQLLLNNDLTIGPKYIIAVLECLLLVALAFFAEKKHKTVQRIRRSMAIALIAIISAANIGSLILVLVSLFGAHGVTGRSLLVSGLAIYLTNIIIFGLWYWELDSGVPSPKPEVQPIDFLFPQMTSKDEIPSLSKWNPTFLDYLYVSITNASAFSPTDTMPLTHRAKSLMGVQSTVSLITVALVAARAVNILT